MGSFYSKNIIEGIARLRNMQFVTLKFEDGCLLSMNMKYSMLAEKALCLNRIETTGLIKYNVIYNN